MKLPRALITIGLAVVLTSPAAAQTGDYKFLAGSGVTSILPQVGTYKAELDGKAIDVWCVDFVNHIAPGDAFKVNISTLSGADNLGRTRYGNLQTYQQAAWLASQFATTPTANWGYLHIAIWNLTTPGTPSAFSAAIMAQVNWWLGQAATEYSKYNYSNVYVLTDVAVAACKTASPTAGPWNGCGHQEHIYVDGRLTMTPEPASMALLAIGLVGLSAAGVVRRRREKQRGE